MQNKRYPAHPYIVAAASPFLFDLLEASEGSQREISTEQLDVNTWEVVLDYMYSRKIKVSSLACTEILGMRNTATYGKTGAFDYPHQGRDEQG